MDAPDARPAGPAAPAIPGSGGPGSVIGLKSGTKLGKYEIVGRLGLGGMALVYKAYDPLLDRFVAIKQIASHLAADPKFMDRFRKEAQILAKLGADQGSVVQIYELIEDPRGLFIVMEYVEGQTLDVLITRHKGPMPVQLALEILWHLAAGLRAVHSKGIIHRDIKPANIMVGVNHRCKITDFGVAARHGGKTSMTLGTTKYMAPELFGGEEVDGRVDIYSLGCIVFEMLCGTEKFGHIFHDVLRDEQAEALRWMKWHTNRELMAPMLNQVNPAVPEVLAKIVAKMMAKDPRQRFASAEHLLEILKRHFTQNGKAKNVQAKKASVAKAAAAAKPVQRVPEPIPDRPAEQVVAAAVAPGGSPVAIPVSPLTTRLPKRKLTRRQRIIVLCSIIGAMLVGLLAWGIIVKGRQNAIDSEAGRRFDLAKAEWHKPNFDREHKIWINANYETGRRLLVELNSDPELSETYLGGKIARANIDWIDARLAMQTASNLSRQLWPTTDQPIAVPEGKTCQEAVAEQRTKIADQWKIADAKYKSVSSAGILPEKTISDLDNEIQYEKGFIKKVDDAVEMIEAGLANCQIQPIKDSARVLEDAQAIKKNEDLTPLFDYRKKKEAECNFLAILRLAKSQLPDKPADAETLLKQALAMQPDNVEVIGLLRKIESDRTFGQVKAAAESFWDASTDELKSNVDPNQAKDAMSRLDAAAPSEYTKSHLYRLETGFMYQKAEKAMNSGQFSIARDGYEQVLKRQYLKPETKRRCEQAIASMQSKETLNTLWADARKAVASADTDADVNTAKSLLAKLTAYPGVDQTEVAKLTESLRQRRMQREWADAEKAMAARKWDEALGFYNRAANHAGNDTDMRTRIQGRLEEITVRKQAEKMLADGDTALSQGKYELALTEYKKLLDYAGKLRDALKPPPPPPANPRGPRGVQGAPPPGNTLPKVPPSLIQEIENAAKDRIRQTNYQRFISYARTDLERGQLQAAESWVNQAIGQKDTAEARKLQGEIEEAKARAGK
jgi:tetratricopeptide (TPR) repeat protein